MSNTTPNGTPHRSPVGPSIRTQAPKDSSRSRGDATPKELTVHVMSPNPGDDWPQIVFTGDGDYRPITSIIKTIVRKLWHYDPEAKIWSAQPDHLQVRIETIRAQGYNVKDHRPKAPELADQTLTAMGDDDQIDAALESLDGKIDHLFYTELLAARDRRRGLTQ